MSTDLASHRGLCPIPFLQESTFPITGGFVPGRFCVPVPQVANLTCCLPCPTTDWVYADGFDKRTEIASWVNVAAFILTVFLFVSFIVLPVKWTHRHYLTMCLLMGVMSIELAFIVPLATQPDQCFNAITPNDLTTSNICAVSGAFLLFGGWAVIVWVLLRALSLHLQICWEVVPGKRFFYTALIVGWAIPAIGLALTLNLTGVSYRFGNVCHINHKNALADTWGPLLAFAAIALVLQFITLGYCVQVYVKSLLDNEHTTNSSNQVPTYSGSISTTSARQTYKRVKRIVELQWRGASVVLLIIGEVVFFSIVFVSMDNSTQITDELLKKARPWLQCLSQHKGDKASCANLSAGLVKSESIVLAVLIVLGLSGFFCLILLGRWSMLLGWKDLLERRLLKPNEFVSADAKRFSNDPRRYEMLGAGAIRLESPSIKSPDKALMSPLSMTSSPFSPDMDSKQEYFGRTRAYISPVQSYSTPRPPSSGQKPIEWDPNSTFASPTQGFHSAFSADKNPTYS